MNNIASLLKNTFQRTLRLLSIFIIASIAIATVLITPDVIWPFSVNFFSLGHSFFGAFGVSITAVFFLLLSYEFSKTCYSMIQYHNNPNNKSGYMLTNELLPMLKPDKNITSWSAALYVSYFVFTLSLLIWMSSFWGMLHSPFKLGESYIYLRHIAFFGALTPAPFLLYKTTKFIFKDANMMEDAPAPITVIFTIICTIFYIGYF